MDETVNSADEPVVLFALEWCEFSWTVRKLFKSMELPFRSVDLDSVAYQKDNWGGEVRAALRARIGAPTIPQIFVGGRYIGGASETIEAFNDGSLQQRLSTLDIDHTPQAGLDARSLLPGWLHPR